MNPSNQQFAGDIVHHIELAEQKPVNFNYRSAYPKRKLLSLAAPFEDAINQDKAITSHYLSAYRGEGAEAIAFELADSLAIQTEKRVLYIDAAPHRKALTRELAEAISRPLDAGTKQVEPAKNSVFVKLQNSHLFYTYFEHINLRENTVRSFDYTEAIKALKQHFDVIVISSENALSSSNIALFSALSDISVIVLEAEKTRIPVAKELITMIEQNGGTVGGTILNKRKFYIPHSLYTMLFKRNS